VGRATRLHPGKGDALIVDFVGASSRHELVTLGALFGLPASSLEQQSVLEAIAAEEQAHEQRRAAAAHQERRRIEDIIGRPVDLFHRKPLHWAQQGGVYALSIPGGSLACSPLATATGPCAWRVAELWSRAASACTPQWGGTRWPGPGRD
jgi:hypothetical protein